MYWLSARIRLSPGAITLDDDFAKTLGHVLHRPAIATIPAFALRLMYGELADEALLAGQRVLPRALEAAQFSFLYPTLDAALRHELGRE